MPVPATGPGEDMTRQPSSASPDPHLRGELETTNARVRPSERRRDRKPYRASNSIVKVKGDALGVARPGIGDDRSRPGFTTLIELLSEEHCVD